MASTAGGAAMGGAHVGRRSIASTSSVTSGWASEPKALGEVSTVENKAVSKTPDTSVITEKETTSKQITTATAPAVATTSTPVADIQGMTAELINILTGKLDIVISRLDTSNDIQDQLLKYSRV
jgi:siroheme synthase